MKHVVHILGILLFVILATNGLYYIHWNEHLPSIYIQGIVFLLPFFYIFNYSYCNRQEQSGIILIIAFIPFISTLLKMLSTGESYLSIAAPILLGCAFFIYFVFWRFQFKEEYFVISFIIIGSITFIIQLLQLFGGMDVLFDSVRNTDIEGGARNGIYRYGVGSSFIQLFCLYYFWEKSSKKVISLYFLIFTLFALSVYLYLIRQIMISSIITIALSLLFLTERRNSKTKIGILISIIVFLLLVNYYWEALFANIIKDTRADTYSLDIRFKAWTFFLHKSMDNPMMFLLGHGESLMEDMWRNIGLYASDIGFIGELYHYGLIWVLAYFYMVYQIVYRYRREVPLYIKLYMIGTMINSSMIFPYHRFPTAFIWCSIYYIANLHIRKARLINNVKAIKT